MGGEPMGRKGEKEEKGGERRESLFLCHSSIFYYPHRFPPLFLSFLASAPLDKEAHTRTLQCCASSEQGAGWRLLLPPRRRRKR